MDFSHNLLNPTQLEQVIDNSYDGIMVTDKTGKIMLVNSAAVYPMKMTIDEIIGMNVQDLVKKKVNDRSTTMEAIKSRTQITGLVNTISGIKVMSTSIPLFDKNGEVVMVITNTRSKDLIESFVKALEKERKNVAHYKNIIHHLDDTQNKQPIAKSQKMKKIINELSMIAKTDVTVLLMGETGTGKEVIARYIHQQSNRYLEPFIAVNCGAVPYNLAESEFFGYEKGAFSGANPQGKMGFFEMARNGTLFLDEISELPLDMQSKLLRVLETKEFRRLGGTGLIKPDARLIAASNKNLEQLVQKKLFREDLYYRLNVVPVTLPPLRERSEDIILFANEFLNEYNKKYGYEKKFNEKTIQALKDYSWPGNIRELRNIIERAVIISYDKKEIDLNLESEPEPEHIDTLTLGSTKETLKEKLDKVERLYINRVLQECNGRIGETANRLGIHRTALYKKLKKEQ